MEDERKGREEVISAYRYADKDLKMLLKSITILIDQREKSISHIAEAFDKNDIKYKMATLSYGDYSFFLPRNDELGITRDLYFDKFIAIERKNSLEELSGNLSKDRQRFSDEFLRANKCKLSIMVESGSLSDIIEHKYDTDFNPAAYLASLFSFQYRYGVNVSFINKENAWKYIYGQFYYYLREELK